MHLVVTIDTEEDHWGHDGPRNPTVDNIRRIPELQRLFDDFGVIPTYLVTYPVATDESANSILRSILAAGRCEIGTHCHPWNTPPFAASQDALKESMLCNLPTDLQHEKIDRLHRAIERAFDTPPMSFRCGRWGFAFNMATHLVDMGYTVDTSVTPYMDWTADCGPDFSTIPHEPFRFRPESALLPGIARPLLEVPVTIGFLQPCFALTNAILRVAQRPPLNHLRLVGVLDRLRLATKVWLSPEVSTTAQMIGLTKRMLRQSDSILNLTFHSPSLQPGLTPFVRSRVDEQRFFRSLRDYLSFARDAGVRPIRLSDTPRML